MTDATDLNLALLVIDSCRTCSTPHRAGLRMKGKMTMTNLHKTVQELQALLEARMGAPIENGKVHPDMRYLCVYDLFVDLCHQLEDITNKGE